MKDTRDPVRVTHDGELDDEERPPADSHYVFRDQVGKGGMGTVHRVHDPSLSRDVALKVLSRGKRGNRMRRHRFLTEAQVTAQLDHPNIVPIYGLEHTEEGQPAIAMKLVRGRTFQDYIGDIAEKMVDKRPLAPSETLNERLDAFLRVCEAIAYAHNRGVLHRDLKPENFMLGPFGEVYVMDWGIAKVMGGPPDPKLDALQQMLADAGQAVMQVTGTADGLILGTPLYMSPEQAMADKELGPASDQYSLGLVLWEMVCLQPARMAKTGRDAIAMARGNRNRKLERFDGVAIPPDLAAIIHKATSLDPDDRYADVAAFAADIERFQRGEAVLARPDSMLRRFGRWSRQHPGAIVGSFATVVAGSALIVMGSMSAVLGVQQRAAREAQHTTELISTVARRSHEIDDVLLRYRSLLEGLSDSAEALWANGAVDTATVLYDRQMLAGGQTPADWAKPKTYDQPVSFTDSLFLRAPRVDASKVEADVRRLAPLNGRMRSMFLRSHADEAVAWDANKQARLLAHTGVTPTWSYIGLENGVLINYPALARMPADYDPRQRPWYLAAKGKHHAVFGEPYADASGEAILIGVNKALYGPDGKMFGVTGLDFGLDAVVDLLALPELEGVAETWLVNAQGTIVVDSRQRGMQTDVGTHGNASLPDEPFPVAAVRQAIVAGEPFGRHETPTGSIVFNRMNAVDWVYVVEIDE